MTGLNINGILPVMTNADLEAELDQATEANNKPIIQGLAGYVRRCWEAAYMSKRQTIEQQLLQCVRQRNGEYDPDVLARIQQTGGSEIYMMLTSNKCRAAASWIRDVILSTNDDKPWGLEPTSIPALSPDRMPDLVQQATKEAMAIEQAMGQQVVDMHAMREIATRIHDRMLADIRQEAQKDVERMEDKMQDQLQQGRFYQALNEFIDDLVTFPFAVLKGPVIRNRPELTWVKGPAGDYQPNVQMTMQLEWERVDPFMFYWAPHSTDVDDGFIIERHHLTRSDLEAMIGVEGYNDDAIRAVLHYYGINGAQDWLYIDAAKALVENKSLTAVFSDPETPIDALQFWGDVQGQMLIDWGMDPKEVPDPLKNYSAEVWVIRDWVIKATLNYDPLGRKPYYKACYEEIPGGWGGNGVADLVRDCQTMCNATARAMANNMGLSSGPQVWVNVDRLPRGESITTMYPWKVWQTTSDPYNSGTAPPLQFFQPDSHAQELMGIYEAFSGLADEYSGIPRYMGGDGGGLGGAGRTSSGISMLMGNAGKAIKQVIYNMDAKIMSPALERLYYYNMRYSNDPDLKGDVRVIARGAVALMVKEQAQVRTNEFLNIVASNPLFTQIVGEPGIAELLRQVAKRLDMDTDRIVPPAPVLQARLNQQQAAQQQATQQAQLMQHAAMQENLLNIQAKTALERQKVVTEAAKSGIPAAAVAHPMDPMSLLPTAPMPASPAAVSFAPGGPGSPSPAPAGPPLGRRVMPVNGQHLATGAPVTKTFQPHRR